jgi:gamma-glutamyltranspeptidase/glutathione hydrolase
VVQADDHPVLTPGQTVVTNPGIMSMDDLRSYSTRILAPTHVNYRGLDVYGMAPPSSGGSTEGEILNILNGFPLSSEPRAKALFQFIEASRLAYADRNAYVGDPEFLSVPLSGLLDPAFAATRRCLIGDTAAVSPVAPGSPFTPYTPCGGGSASTGPGASAASPEAHHTNNIVTEDRWGDVVGYTNTINFFGGSGQVVPGYGFLLNNEMTDFDFAPPASGASDPNLPAPAKEPRSSMGPIIALHNGQPVFSIGAAGGSTIIETVVQTLINRVDFGRSLPDALAAPRVAQTNSSSNTSLAEPDFYNSALAQQLTSQYGERFSLATGPILPLDNYPGDATALQMLPGGRAEAIAEPVRLSGGSALALPGNGLPGGRATGRTWSRRRSGASDRRSTGRAARPKRR